MRSYTGDDGFTRPVTIFCKLCGASTREGKEYCSEHVEMLPYVQDLHKRMTEALQEEQRIFSRGSAEATIDSICAKDILLYLKLNGAHTIARLARELNRNIKVIRGYVLALKAHSLVSTRRNRQGATVVEGV